MKTPIQQAEVAKERARLRYLNAIFYRDLVATNAGPLGPEYRIALAVVERERTAFVETMDVIVDLYTGTVRESVQSVQSVHMGEPALFRGVEVDSKASAHSDVEGAG